MFEKEAEEWRNSLNYEIDNDTFNNIVIPCIEFGYNKANEWHYVKDGDLPKDDKQYLVLFFYNYKGKKEMSCGVRDNLHSDFEIKRCYTEQIIAWKEIVLPEFPKESR